MCRSCSEGGRRCARTEVTSARERTASARYYQRGVARRRVAVLADAGIPAITDIDMPPSYHMHEEGQPLDLTKSLRTLANPQHAMPDKPEGALWAAPGRTDQDGSTKTAWTDWIARNWQSRLAKGEALAEIKARPGAVIVCINTREDAQNLMDSYGTIDAAGKRAFDWEAMRHNGIDAVYVNGNMAHPIGEDAHHAASNFYAWDTASVVWLTNEKAEVADIKPVGVYEYESAAEDDDPDAYRDVKIDEGFGDYREPPRPDLDSAWSNVPKRFRPKETAPPHGQGASGGQEPTAGSSSVYEYTHPGATAPKEMDVLDVGIAVLGVATKVKRAKANKPKKAS